MNARRQLHWRRDRFHLQENEYRDMAVRAAGPKPIFPLASPFTEDTLRHCVRRERVELVPLKALLKKYHGLRAVCPSDLLYPRLVRAAAAYETVFNSGTAVREMLTLS